MIYIEKIKVINKTFPSNVLSKDFEIQCSSVNLLVGNQGCGKSTLLKLIQQNHSDLELTLSDIALNKSVDTFYFDSEKDNPRTKDPKFYTDINDTNRGIGFTNSIGTRFLSHGEVLEKFTVNAILKAKDCVVLLDEPESGLSITNQFKLIENINKAVKKNCQIFIATHCYPLIEAFDVISLEHHKQMKGSEFISNIKTLKQ